jgi:hypothetical protein
LQGGRDTFPAPALRALEVAAADQSLTDREIINRLWDVVADPHLKRVLGPAASARRKALRLPSRPRERKLECVMLATKQEPTRSAERTKGAKMAETKINMVDALRGQQDQLRRLIAQKMWISDAPKATLSEMEAQIGELKRLLAELEKDIQDQIKRGQ